MLKTVSIASSYIAFMIGAIMMLSGTEYSNRYCMLPGAILLGSSIIAHAVVSLGDNNSSKISPRG
jgi:hypothetical protein